MMNHQETETIELYYTICQLVRQARGITFEYSAQSKQEYPARQNIRAGYYFTQ